MSNLTSHETGSSTKSGDSSFTKLKDMCHFNISLNASCIGIFANLTVMGKGGADLTSQEAGSSTKSKDATQCTY